MTPSPSARPTSITTDRTRTSASNCFPCTRKSSRRSATCCGRNLMLPLRNLVRSFLVVALALTALPLLAEDDASRFEVKYAKDFPYSGGRVTIDHGFGSLAIRTHAGNTVQVRATIRSSDDAIGKQIHITGTEGSGGVTVRTDFPEIHNYHGNLSYSVEIMVSVPANAPVTAKNRFGSTSVQGLQAPSSIETKQGSITFRD